jgi:hypothetical protein
MSDNLWKLVRKMTTVRSPLPASFVYGATQGSQFQMHWQLLEHVNHVKPVIIDLSPYTIGHYFFDNFS